LKGERFLLRFGSENSTAWPSEPWPVAQSYDFDPEASYPVILDEEEAGHCKVERDFDGGLYVRADFEITFNPDEVRFFAFWEVKGDKALLTQVQLLVRRTPTQPWV